MKSVLETELWDSYPLICGIDEAGRGPLCGPVVVAGVIFDPGYENPLIDDSKKLSEKKREKLIHQIKKDARKWMILVVDEKTIDEYNIYHATRLAMEKIAEKLAADLTLTDAKPLKNGVRHAALIKGDARALSIAAASILAKTTRDHYMYELDRQYPQYGLAKHKGYPTKAHLQAIEEYGVQPFYRRSFGPVQKILTRENELKLFELD